MGSFDSRQVEVITCCAVVCAACVFTLWTFSFFRNFSVFSFPFGRPAPFKTLRKGPNPKSSSAAMPPKKKGEREGDDLSRGRGAGGEGEGGREGIPLKTPYTGVDKICAA